MAVPSNQLHLSQQEIMETHFTKNRQPAQEIRIGLIPIELYIFCLQADIEIRLCKSIKE